MPAHSNHAHVMRAGLTEQLRSRWGHTSVLREVVDEEGEIRSGGDSLVVGAEGLEIVGVVEERRNGADRVAADRRSVLCQCHAARRRRCANMPASRNAKTLGAKYVRENGGSG